MRYRKLGKTGLMVSEIGLGAEWLERHSQEECTAVIDSCASNGINILDCWMVGPHIRSSIGHAIEGKRENWVIQGHIGSTWQKGQYVRTRDVEKCKIAFQDLLDRLGTNYIDLGMIHYVDHESDWNNLVNGPYLEYVYNLKEKGIIRHIGMGTHNPAMAKIAIKSGIIENLMFSVNPAFDILPETADNGDSFSEDLDESLGGISPSRADLYRLCEKEDIGITVMKGFAGGRLFDAKASPFGVALTPVQCLHYCLTRPAVTSVMAGMETVEQVESVVSYETASKTEKDYASTLAGAPHHAYRGQCTYCGHCKPCPTNIDIAMVNKLYDLAVMQTEVPSSVRDHYFALEKTAVDCIGCRSCEPRCPFGVKIAERMIKAKELFK